MTEIEKMNNRCKILANMLHEKTQSLINERELGHYAPYGENISRTAICEQIKTLRNELTVFRKKLEEATWI